MKNINVLIDSNIPLLSEAIADFANVSIFEGGKLTNQKLIAAKCTMLFVRSTTQVNKELLNGTEVKFVATATSGSEHLDKIYLEANKIAYFDAIGSNALSVAEYVIFAILFWAQENNKPLDGKKIGIIGFGNVGKRVAYFARLLGLELWVNDPPLVAEGYAFPEGLKVSNIDEIFQNCDIITNHVPLELGGKFPTHNLIDGKLISMITQGSLFVHASRGGVVRESVWIEAAVKNQIVPIIDVWENEPYISSEAMRAARLATPHVAGHAFDAKLKGTLDMARAFEEFTGQKPNCDIILNELNNSEKIDLSNWNNENIYQMLLKSREIPRIHQAFLGEINNPDENITNEENISDRFKSMRKNFPCQREVFPEKW